MLLEKLWLTNFRNYREAEVELDPKLTAVVGDNGEGKSNLLEAIGWLCGLRSFRSAPTEALIRAGADSAIVRGQATRAERALLIECEITAQGRSRMLVNRQPLRRGRDGLDHLRAVVFAPDDLELLKGGPSGRRDFLDDLLVALDPRAESNRTDLDRILRQRSALLKQSGGRISEEINATLQVWDARFVAAGEAWAHRRADLIAELAPTIEAAYRDLAGAARVSLSYAPSWLEGGLAAALAEVRRDEARRGVCLVGPHRDDIEVTLNDMAARTHASQGEQRSLALALRLAAARHLSAVLETEPLLLLDDVFSELDPRRCEALLANLPAGQTIITTATQVPAPAAAALTVRVSQGTVSR